MKTQAEQTKLSKAVLLDFYCKFWLWLLNWTFLIWQQIILHCLKLKNINPNRNPMLELSYAFEKSIREANDIERVIETDEARINRLMKNYYVKIENGVFSHRHPRKTDPPTMKYKHQQKEVAVQEVTSAAFDFEKTDEQIMAEKELERQKRVFGEPEMTKKDEEALKKMVEELKMSKLLNRDLPEDELYSGIKDVILSTTSAYKSGTVITSINEDLKTETDENKVPNANTTDDLFKQVKEESGFSSAHVKEALKALEGYAKMLDDCPIEHFTVDYDGEIVEVKYYPYSKVYNKIIAEADVRTVVAPIIGALEKGVDPDSVRAVFSDTITCKYDIEDKITKLGVLVQAKEGRR